MRIFVSGGSGFIGSNLIRRLIKDGHQIEALYSIGENDPPEGLRSVFYTGLCGIDWPVVSCPDVVFHQAANNDIRCNDHYTMMQSNVYDTLTFFRKMHEKGCRKFVYASTTAVYGQNPAPYYEDSTPLNPLDVYSWSKMKMEEELTLFAERTKSTVIGLRYCNVYGPGEGHKGRRMSSIGQMIRALRKRKKISLFSPGDQKREWIYVEDVVEANVLAMHSSMSGIYNIGTGKSISFYELVKTVASMFEPMPVNTNKWIEYVDHPSPEQYQNHMECNIEKARRMLSYVPSIDIKLGIIKYLGEFVPSELLNY